MTQWIKQNTSVTLKQGPFLSSTDGFTPQTGLTISQGDVRLSKNGGDYAQKSETTAGVHDELGEYDIALNATDTNTLGLLRLLIVEAGALPVWDKFMVVPANVYDSFFGADRLQVHVDEMTAGIITAAVIATDAIDADALAAGAIDAAVLATGAITNAKFAAGAIDAAAIADGAIDANTFATGAITAAAIAADAITDAKVAADVTIASVTGSVGSVTGSVGSVTGSVGSVTGAVASVTGAVGSVTGNVGGNVVGSVGSLAAQAKTDVNNEVLDVLNVDTFAEIGQETPAATQTIRKMLAYLYKFMRNRVTVTGSAISVYNDDGTTIGQKSTHSDNGTTYDRGEYTTGP